MLNQIDYLVQLQEAITQLEDLLQKQGAVEPGGEVEALQRKIDRLKKKLGQPTLRRFEMIIERRQGRALAPIRESACGACGLILPHQTVIDVSTSLFLIPCEACGRLLYWDTDSRVSGVEYRVSHDDSSDSDSDDEPEREREPVSRKREKRKRFLSGPDQRAGEALIARLEAKRVAETEALNEAETDEVVTEDADIQTEVSSEEEKKPEPIHMIESEAADFASDEPDIIPVPDDRSPVDKNEVVEPEQPPKPKRTRKKKTQPETLPVEPASEPEKEPASQPKKKPSAKPVKKQPAKQKKTSPHEEPVKPAPKAKAKSKATDTAKRKPSPKKAAPKKTASTDTDKKHVAKKAKAKTASPKKKAAKTPAKSKAAPKKAPAKKKAAPKTKTAPQKAAVKKSGVKKSGASKKAAPKAAPKKKSAAAKTPKPKSPKPKSVSKKSARSTRASKKN